MQVLGYVRVSTEEQGRSGIGLEAQREAIAAECERRGWVLLEVIEDAGYSAKNLNRPGIQSALDRLKAGEAEGLVAAKMDRLSRSLLNFASLMEDSVEQGWQLVALDGAADTTTPQGKMMAGVLATFAQYERDIIGERVRATHQVQRRNGKRMGRKRQTPEALIERIVGEREQGSTLQAIADPTQRRWGADRAERQALVAGDGCRGAEVGEL